MLINGKEIKIKPGADLARADLADADLARANLARANLARADLADADLTGANLAGANLTGANLRGAYLRGAYLGGADLADANLAGANLRGAYLRGAYLGGADLRGATIDKDQSDMHSIVPESGEFTGWKKCRNGVIIRLTICADAKRSNATGRKCRASSAVVSEIIGGEIGVSIHDPNFVYRKGETVSVSDFCEDRWQECAAGIHFFITRSEAQNYDY